MTKRLRAAALAALMVATIGLAVPAHAGDAPGPRPSRTPSEATDVVGEWRSERIAVKQTVTFTANGKVFGNAGCNNFSGSYKVRSWFITISPLATTFKLCEDAVMHAEQKFLKKLQSATRVDYDPSCGPAGLVFDTPYGYLWVTTTTPPDPDLPPLACTGNARPFGNARP